MNLNVRSELYMNLNHAATEGKNDPSSAGKRIVLSSSFTGGRRYIIQNYQDAMVICRHHGYPDLFITFTCNTKFVEEQGLRPEDRPDIICRVFKMKLDDMISTIRSDEFFFGKVKSVLYTIEFQKRGLPHAHIVVFLEKSAKLHDPDDIDLVISTEIPDTIHDPHLFMLHGPCGSFNTNSVY
ncbi:hypothetical protein V2J09_016476 [Rumex salicifolius]